MIYDRDARQELSIKRWLDAGGRATLELATGFGKTFVACKIIQRMQAKDSRRTAIIIVPKINLKSQWERELAKFKVKAKVYVVNTVVLNPTILQTDLLVLDEAHKYSSDISVAGDNSFVRIFERIKYKWLLCLTATVKRLDGHHKYLESKAPIVDTITMEDARENGWVSDYDEVNFGITLNSTEQEALTKLNSMFNSAFAWFNFDFGLAMGCTGARAEEYARELNKPKGEVIGQAVKFNKAMQLRKFFFYNLQQKHDIVREIVNRYTNKTIIFSESTDFASKLNDSLGDISVEYHSYIKSQERLINGKVKKFGKKKLLEEALTKLKDNRYKIRAICTAKALDEGFDDPSIEIGIIASFTSNPTQYCQRIGRVSRLLKKGSNKTKSPFIINIYVRDSQEEKWLTKAQEGKDIDEVYSLEELFERMDEKLKPKQ